MRRAAQATPPLQHHADRRQLAPAQHERPAAEGAGGNFTQERQRESVGSKRARKFHLERWRTLVYLELLPETLVDEARLPGDWGNLVGPGRERL